MTNNDFLPSDYEAPKGNSNYMKFQKGENRFRILSKPVLGWLDWEDKKPLRFQMKQKPEAPIDPKKPIKHFWAITVWDYTDNAIKVLEITQSSIQKAITDLAKDSDWGNPVGYDIKVVRKGDGMETEYSINPVPHKPISEEIKEAYMNRPTNLEALFSGGDPFEVKTGAVVDDLPF